MNFDNEKKQALEKLDRSKKGSLDRPIRKLLGIINNHADFYTTSSCSGRILLLTTGKRKNETEWLFTSHNPVEADQIFPVLKNIPRKTVWFRMEPPILHLCARDLEVANGLLNILNNQGFRRSALLSFSNRKVIEVLFTSSLNVPIAENKLLVSNQYLDYLVHIANRKLTKAHKKIKKLEEIFLSLHEKTD